MGSWNEPEHGGNKTASLTLQYVYVSMRERERQRVGKRNGGEETEEVKEKVRRIREEGI